MNILLGTLQGPAFSKTMEYTVIIRDSFRHHLYHKIPHVLSDLHLILTLTLPTKPPRLVNLHLTVVY